MEWNVWSSFWCCWGFRYVKGSNSQLSINIFIPNRNDWLMYESLKTTPSHKRFYTLRNSRNQRNMPSQNLFTSLDSCILSSAFKIVNFSRSRTKGFERKLTKKMKEKINDTKWKWPFAKNVLPFEMKPYLANGFYQVTILKHEADADARHAFNDV